MALRTNWVSSRLKFFTNPTVKTVSRDSESRVSHQLLGYDSIDGDSCGGSDSMLVTVEVKTVGMPCQLSPALLSSSQLSLPSMSPGQMPKFAALH